MNILDSLTDVESKVLELKGISDWVKWVQDVLYILNNLTDVNSKVLELHWAVFHVFVRATRVSLMMQVLELHGWKWHWHVQLEVE